MILLQLCCRCESLWLSVKASMLWAARPSGDEASIFLVANGEPEAFHAGGGPAANKSIADP